MRLVSTNRTFCTFRVGVLCYIRSRTLFIYTHEVRDDRIIMTTVFRKTLSFVIAAAATEASLDLPKGTVYTQLLIYDSSGTLVTVTNVRVELDGSSNILNTSGALLQRKNIIDHHMMLGVVGTTGLFVNSGTYVIDFERDRQTHEGAIDSSLLTNFKLFMTCNTNTTFYVLTEELVG